jgi:plasmid stabilization system protein ParE
MPPVAYAPSAISDLVRLREFLLPKNPIAANKAIKTIRKALLLLGHHPKIGRPIDDMPEEFRDWIIDFGDSGYIARYRFDSDMVTVLAVRHQKELGVALL